jgi:6,7-dimethyl-8-ribityllumazine synthase
MGKYTEYEGKPDATGMRLAIVAGRFNADITKLLLDGAQHELADLGLERDSVPVVWVPGAFEIPLVAKQLVESGELDAVICLGAVIRGDTPHFDFVAGEAASGLQLAAIETGVPVAFGVLTTESQEQAEERIDRAAAAVRGGLEMAGLFAELRPAAAK